MRLSKNSFYIIILSVIFFSLAGCKKEDPEEIRKEALTRTLLNDIRADSLEADIIWLQDMGTRFSLADNHRNVAVRIKNRFIHMGFTNAKIDSFYVIRTFRSVPYEQWQYDVIATIEGTEYPDSLCIIGGHYDNYLASGDPFTIVHGANDNASGIAAVMEIARVMKKNNYSPSSTIKFVAFGAEEIGLWGSYFFAAHPDGFASRIRFMLNFDMVAYEPEANSALWFVNIVDYDNSHKLRSEAERMCARYTFLNYKNDNTFNKQSDSYPFFMNGYKALFFFSDKLDPNLHTINDIAANCNFTYCREIVKLSCALLINKN
jgi:leucyl aminopeptidase